MQQTRLLGFAPLAGADALLSAMRAVPGPCLHMQSGPSVIALLQDEPDVSLVGRSRDELVAGLQSVQRRLEVACSAGAFLPMDPAASCAPAGVLSHLLDTRWDDLAEVLAAQGARQQWDIVLSWSPEAVVASHRSEIAPAAAHGSQALAEAVGTVLRTECARREAALLAALAPAVLVFAGGGAACTDTQVAITVLVKAGGEAALEAALDGLAPEYVEGASIDMRGPLPPLSFSAVRLATVEEQAVAGAWATLGLPGQIDLSALHRHWRMGAAAVHPDRAGSQNAGLPEDSVPTVSDLTAAYHLLRGLLPLKASGASHTLDSLLRLAGPRLVMPLDPGPGPSPAAVAEQRLAVLT